MVLNKTSINVSYYSIFFLFTSFETAKTRPFLGLKTITIGIQKEPKLELQHFKHFRLERGLRH